MSAKQKKLLMLDDDSESMQGLQLYLHKEMELDVEFSAAANLLKRLDQEKFDLLIVDLMIHSSSRTAENVEVQNIHYDNVKWDRTGLEFIRRFRNGEYTPTGNGTATMVPIIVLSAVADSATDDEWGKIIQNEHHLEKPFRLSELSTLIRRLLQE